MTGDLTEFLVLTRHAQLHELRERLAQDLPQSSEVLVVGDERVLKVHLRTTRPDLALRVGQAFGVLADIVVPAAPASP